MINRKNEIFIGIKILLVYFIAQIFIYDFLLLFGINYNNLSIIVKQIYLFLYDSVVTLIIIYICRKEFILNLKDFFKNFKTYVDKYIRYWYLILILMISSNFIITKFTTEQVSVNQQTIISYLGNVPVYTILSIVIITPIIEELIFRYSLKKIIHNNTLFIIISGLLFGLLHVLGTTNNLIDYLFVIPYSIPGFIFAYIYTKSDNIFVPISMHFLHDTVMLLLQILVMIK